MSFKGRVGGGGRCFGGGRGRGGGNRYQDIGPPNTVIHFGHYGWTVEHDLICKVDIEDVPYFNAPIYLENMEQIGKIDEIFGNIRNYFVSIRLGENIRAESFKEGQRFYIDPAKLLPLQRFISPTEAKRARGRGRGRGGRGGRRGGFRRGGRGGSGFRKGGGGGRAFVGGRGGGGRAFRSWSHGGRK